MVSFALMPYRPFNIVNIRNAVREVLTNMSEQFGVPSPYSRPLAMRGGLPLKANSGMHCPSPSCLHYCRWQMTGISFVPQHGSSELAFLNFCHIIKACAGDLFGIWHRAVLFCELQLFELILFLVIVIDFSS